MSSVSPQRIHPLNDKPVVPSAEFVLYWMLNSRRPVYNFALQHAVKQAIRYQKPLLILDMLPLNFPRLNYRIARFILEGMANLAQAFRNTSVTYIPFIEHQTGEAVRLLFEMSRQAVAIVTDDFPIAWERKLVEEASEKFAVHCEAVDSHGIVPLASVPQVFPTAYAFRRFLQRELPDHLDRFPIRNPLARVELPKLKRLPLVPTRSKMPLEIDSHAIASKLPITQSISRGYCKGGGENAELALKDFVGNKLHLYSEFRNEPEQDVASGLSPYLHFGHISAHQVFIAIAKHEKWTADRLSHSMNGAKAGWWGMNENAESFLDQLVTWRELGYNFSAFRDDYAQFDSLPDWAKHTLHRHAADIRPHVYTYEQLESASTHDQLWNAAQRQLVTEGRIHNYLRMLWGKKILEWSRSPEQAAETMIELNDTYALDGRNPNSYSGIFWCLGRYDRPWGPERAVYGTIRYMSSDNTARKVRVRNYIAKYSA